MPVSGAMKKWAIAFLPMVVFFFAGIRDIAAQTVRLPITVDYSLLQNLIIRNAFTEADQSVTLLNKGNGCLFLSLSKPAVSETGGFVRFETQVTVHAGTPVADQCLVPVEWQGILVLYQRPVIDGNTWKLSFVTASSSLLTNTRQPAKIAAVLWDLIKSRVFTYLESIRIDLAPPVNDVKNSLLPMFPQKVQEQTKAMLRTLRTGETRVTPRAVVVDILADVKEVYKPGEAPQTEVLSGKALEDTVGVWEQWDALLSFLVSTLSRNVLTEDEQQTLRDVLLETRYAFVEGLNSQNLTHDFVREQFVKAWRRLSPLFRNHLGQNPDEQTLGYLSFFSAADALSVLDGLGPTFGVEVSRDGLIRMARMLTTDPSVLTYGSAVNPDLQKLFQLMPMLQTDKQEAPADAGERPEASEGRSNEQLQPGPGAEGGQGGGGRQQPPPADRSNGGTPVSPDQKRGTGPDRDYQGAPVRPIEQHDLDIDRAPVPQDRKPADEAGAGKTQEGQQPSSPKVRDDQGNSEGSRSQAVPGKPLDQDTDVDRAFALPDKAVPPEKPAGQGGEKNKDSQPSAPPVRTDPPDQPSKGQTNPRENPQDQGSGAVTPENGQGEVLQASQWILAVIGDFFLAPASAADLSKYDIQSWRVPDGGEEQYFKNVVEVLNRATQSLFGKGELPASMRGMYRSLMIAMAWQESCFHQFVEKDRQMTYLLSYNNTSVGLMQVNERVWRGIYDQERLRWDIEYNAVAGGEIAGLYLQKYALRDKSMAKRLDDATLARLVYAMYNGGPAQYREFLDRQKKGKMLSYDTLFLEKYSAVIAGRWDKAIQCLSGN